MKKVIGFAAALILALGTSSFAQTATEDATKKRAESYGEQNPSADKGQQGELKREQTREEKELKKEAKEQKKEMKEEKKQQKQQGNGEKKGN